MSGDELRGAVAVGPQERSGDAVAITMDTRENYAVFVHQEDAERFTAKNPAWRVEWCVPSAEW